MVIVHVGGDICDNLRNKAVCINVRLCKGMLQGFVAFIVGCSKGQLNLNLVALISQLECKNALNRSQGLLSREDTVDGTQQFQIRSTNKKVVEFVRMIQTANRG